jgi:DNA-binding response OmpR family regulator
MAGRNGAPSCVRDAKARRRKRVPARHRSCWISADFTIGPLKLPRGGVSGRESKASFMRKKILVVEDNTGLLELLRLNLKAAGFAVATAADGIEALKKAHSLSPDLVLLDLILPELDGFAVCETLRKGPATASIPIIVLTGLNNDSARGASLQAGTCDFVTKPVNPKHLVARIKELLRQPRASSSAPKGEKPKLPETPARMAARRTERGPALMVERRP